jgi:hypothetical protein
VKYMEEGAALPKTSFPMPLGLKISLPGLRAKNVYLNRESSIILDNLLGLAVLRRDAAIGQCVSYFRITVDFRQDQGQSIISLNLTTRNTREIVLLVIS